MTIVKEILTQWRYNDPARLLARAIEQAERIEQLSNECDSLRAENQHLLEQLHGQNHLITELQAQLEEAQRAAARQAAPFRIAPQKRASERQRPGQKPGHPGTFRPRPDHFDQQIEVPLSCCPQCGSTSLLDVHPVEQFIEDIPQLRPTVSRLITYHATCADCGQEVCSTHPLKVSTATGAAGTHLGARALALAADLNKAQGLTVRKTCRILKTYFGLSLTPGALSQALGRLANKLLPDYDALRLELRTSAVVHSDETSGWVGGPGYWLWVFTNPRLTLYVIDHSRGRQVVHQQLGTDYGGVLVSDCLAVYDNATQIQHKCYAHHLSAISRARAIHPHNGEGFLLELQSLLKTAITLKSIQPQLPATEFARSRAALEGSAVELLHPPRSDPAEQSVRNRLLKQLDHLFTFLDYPGVDATNNLAERQLRPAVIARKLSCGNKTERGAHTWQIHASLAATCAQQGRSFVDLVAEAARLKQPRGP